MLCKHFSKIAMPILLDNEEIVFIMPAVSLENKNDQIVHIFSWKCIASYYQIKQSNANHIHFYQSKNYDSLQYYTCALWMLTELPRN